MELEVSEMAYMILLHIIAKELLKDSEIFVSWKSKHKRRASCAHLLLCISLKAAKSIRMIVNTINSCIFSHKSRCFWSQCQQLCLIYLKSVYLITETVWCKERMMDNTSFFQKYKTRYGAMLLDIITSNKSLLIFNYSLTLNAILYTCCQHRISLHFASGSYRVPSPWVYMSATHPLQCCLLGSPPRGKRMQKGVTQFYN